jgi:hypothetical protein
LAIKTAESYLDALNSIYLEKGTQGVQDFNRQVQRITRNLNTEDLNKFYANLMSFDWDSQDAWDEFSDTLIEVGINIPEEQLEAFVEQAKEAANAIKKFDLTKVTKQI